MVLRRARRAILASLPHVSGHALGLGRGAVYREARGDTVAFRATTEDSRRDRHAAEDESATTAKTTYAFRIGELRAYRLQVQSETHDVTRLARTLARANIQNRNPDLFTSRTNSMYIETDGRSRNQEPRRQERRG